MIKIVPTGEVFGATIEGVDLARSLEQRDFAQILKALGRRSRRGSAHWRSTSPARSRSRGIPRS